MQTFFFRFSFVSVIHWKLMGRQFTRAHLKKSQQKRKIVEASGVKDVPSDQSQENKQFWKPCLHRTPNKASDAAANVWTIYPTLLCRIFCDVERYCPMSALHRKWTCAESVHAN